MRVLIGTFVLTGHFKDAGYAPDGTRLYTTGPSDVEISDQSLWEEAAFLRGTEVAVFDRANEKTSITLTVSREFISSTAAEVFMIEHRGRVPRLGLVTLESKSTTGAIVNRYLRSGSCRIASMRLQGVSTWATYQITGGALLTKKP